MIAPRLADVVAREIEQRVLEGRLKVGDRLPSERDLSVELGVSRASLREAIHKLASRGLLESRQGGGTFVTDRVVDNHVVTLRKKIEPEPSAPRYLVSVRGLGYRFDG